MQLFVNLRKETFLKVAAKLPQRCISHDRNFSRNPLYQFQRSIFTRTLKSTKTLPTKVPLELRPIVALGQDKQHMEHYLERTKKLEARIPTAIKQPSSDTSGGSYKLHWTETPRTVLIVKKPNDQGTEKALIDMVNWLHENYPKMNIVLEPSVADFMQRQFPFVYVIPEGYIHEYSRAVDFIVTLGGDGTILHTSSLFEGPVPPILSFSMGTLGFLIRFNIKDYQKALDQMIAGDVSMLLRMRLLCSVHSSNGERIVWNGVKTGDYLAMNEVNIHRGRYPHLAQIEINVNGQHLTHGVSDGILVATPTGSTAYSLSAGGPIVHPSVKSILLTPICPRSLSFRPVLLPTDTSLKLKLSDSCRGNSDITVDGREICMMPKGGYLNVCMSPYPVPCVNRLGEASDWVRDINELLKWNQNFGQKSSLLQNDETESEKFEEPSLGFHYTIEGSKRLQ
ncbi:NADH kinase pos5 [Basidiobolus ranarum]|uniref:NADH kinase pos5 n=2 Tax=Basidiobolus ranarum TaxID=34480 RepID=A0ABR2WZK0_9FUNG